MNPQNPQQQYDFILNPETPAKKPVLIPGGNSLAGRLLVLCGVLVLLSIVIIIAASVFGKKSTSIVGLTAVAQDQTELVRVAKLGTSQADSQTLQNAAISIQLSVSSADQQLLTYLAGTGHKLSGKELVLKHDSRTDSQLKTAADASNFDSTFVDVLEAQLTTYRRDLKAAYAANPGPKGRILLSSQYNGAGLLLTQLKQQ